MLAEALEELAAMPAGAELSAALHAVRLDEVANDRMLDVLRAQYRQLSHEQARMAAVLVEIGRCDGVPAPGAVRRSADADPYAVHESRAALRWTRSTAESEHALAEFVSGRLPAVFAAWSAGEIDRARVRVFEQYLYGLDAEQVAAVCAYAVPRAPSLTTGQLAALLRRLVIAVDPDAAARWYRRRVRERDVCAYMAVDGTVTVSAHGLPADEAEAACRRVERLAAAAQRAGHPGTVGQIRADVFLGLLDGRFHGMDTDQMVAALIADRRRAAVALSATDSPSGEDGGGRCAPGNGPADDHGPPEPCGDEPGGDEPERADPERDDSEHDKSRRGGDRESGGAGGAGHTGRHRGARRSGPADQRLGIEIRVSLSTLLGDDEHPGEIPGLGPVPAPVARARVALQTRAEWRFAVVGSDGVLLSEGRTRHRPIGATRTGSPPGGIVEVHVSEDLLNRLVADPAGAGAWAPVVADIVEQHRNRHQHLVDLDARPGDRLPASALRRHTEIRDRTCTFAGVCRRPAHAGHQDHRRDHAHGGATVAANLGPTCAQDHAVKHRAGWTAGSTPTGGVSWWSPLGGHYIARGEFLCGRLPVPQPDPSPETSHRAVAEGPIMPRPPPAARPTPRAPVDGEDDEPPF